MKQYCIVLILVALLALGHAQDDIQIEAIPVGNAGDGFVGAPERVNLGTASDSLDAELMAEVVARCKTVYSGNSNYSQDPLKEIVSVSKQVVAGLLYRIVWKTEGGNQFQVSVHIVPWMHGESRFPTVQNAIVAL